MERQTNINSIFDKMELQGVNTEKPLLYGYFFCDRDKSKLERLWNELVKDNYKLIRIEMTEKKEFILHVEKVEIHSRKSLLERENQLDELSKRIQVATYDGWNVGNPDPLKPLVSNGGSNKLLDSKSDDELFRIAEDLYDNDAYDKAIMVFQKCIERSYKLDTSYYKQGVSYISIGQTQIGIKKLEEALRINPQYFKACFNIGAACYDIQEYEKSIEYYQKAAKIESNYDGVYYGMAASQFVLGQIKGAEINCQKALAIDPSNNNAKTLLDRIENRR